MRFSSPLNKSFGQSDAKKEMLSEAAVNLVIPQQVINTALKELTD